MPFPSEKRLYLNADRTKVVAEDSPEASFLLVGEGGEVSDEDAKTYGLKAAEAPETKQVKAPPENKGG
jgi:hypothetical protein